MNCLWRMKYQLELWITMAPWQCKQGGRVVIQCWVILCAWWKMPRQGKHQCNGLLTRSLTRLISSFYGIHFILFAERIVSSFPVNNPDFQQVDQTRNTSAWWKSCCCSRQNYWEKDMVFGGMNPVLCCYYGFVNSMSPISCHGDSFVIWRLWFYVMDRIRSSLGHDWGFVIPDLMLY